MTRLAQILYKNTPLLNVRRGCGPDKGWMSFLLHLNILKLETENLESKENIKYPKENQATWSECFNNVGWKILKFSFIDLYESNNTTTFFKGFMSPSNFNRFIQKNHESIKYMAAWKSRCDWKISKLKINKKILIFWKFIIHEGAISFHDVEFYGCISIFNSLHSKIL